MLGWSVPLGFLRAALFGVLIVLGFFGPQTADAHVDDPVASVTSDAHGIAEQKPTRAPVEEALGHCHPGLDCAVTAIPVELARLRLANSLFRKGFRSGSIRLTGLGLSDDPPPPRPFV